MSISQQILNLSKQLFDSNHFTHLKNKHIINDLINMNSFGEIFLKRYGTMLDIRFANFVEKKVHTREAFFRRINGDNIALYEIEKHTCMRYLNSGFTMIIDSAEDQYSQIDKVVNELKASLNHSRISTSLYFSKREANSFGYHFDPHHIIAVQIHGRKKWHLHPPTYNYPVVGSKKLDVYRPSINAFVTITTEPMDILVIPMGLWHMVETPEDASLHLSIALDPSRIGDCFNEIFNTANNEEIFRKPVGGIETLEDIKIAKNRMIELIKTKI